ncbi:MAG: hypothetical protein PF569_08780 [Candidatus Woesearchaeota archaeon]|jgi:hypothetical protein|nr:hypothetical protein [Candidatus Woesearchaeota archaeon]
MSFIKQYLQIQELLNCSSELENLERTIEIQIHDLRLDSEDKDEKTLIELTSIKIYPLTPKIIEQELIILQSKFIEKITLTKNLKTTYSEESNKSLKIGISKIIEEITKGFYKTLRGETIGTFGIQKPYRELEMLFYPNKKIAQFAHETGKHQYEIPLEIIEKERKNTKNLNRKKFKY